MLPLPLPLPLPRYVRLSSWIRHISSTSLFGLCAGIVWRKGIDRRAEGKEGRGDKKGGGGNFGPKLPFDTDEATTRVKVLLLHKIRGGSRRLSALQQQLSICHSYPACLPFPLPPWLLPYPSLNQRRALV